MKKIILMLALVAGSVAYSQKVEKIPYKCYDFLKLAKKHYKEVPVVEDWQVSKDGLGMKFYLYETDSVTYKLYPNNHLQSMVLGATADYYEVKHKVVKIIITEDVQAKRGIVVIRDGINEMTLFDD
ncbi:hypothetical protein [Flavobacterium sp. 3HN19-14]|uniref:hypothetical protein n=1 Tax=Flavobacterium sp. 3HN19-14 TaxID=3448133 RepID=UPI003EE2770A